MTPRRSFLALALVAPAAAFAAPKLPSRSIPVETVFDSPGPKPNGLQATDEGLWILDQGDNHAYLVSYKDGKVLRDLATDTKAGSGITFDGAAIWTASTYSREILRIDAKTGKTLETHSTPGAGVVAWSVGRRSPLAPPPPPAPPASADAKPPQQRQATGAHGLEWRDGKLWIATPPSQTIYRMNPKTWEVELSFPTAGDRPHGIGWLGDQLWCVDSNDNAFYRYNPETGALLEKIQLTDNDPLPHGMTIRDGWMWYCDDVGVVCRLKVG